MVKMIKKDQLKTIFSENVFYILHSSFNYSALDGMKKKAAHIKQPPHSNIYLHCRRRHKMVLSMMTVQFIR